MFESTCANRPEYVGIFTDNLAVRGRPVCWRPALPKVYFGTRRKNASSMV